MSSNKDSVKGRDMFIYIFALPFILCFCFSSQVSINHHTHNLVVKVVYITDLIIVIIP